MQAAAWQVGLPLLLPRVCVGCFLCTHQPPRAPQPPHRNPSRFSLVQPSSTGTALRAASWPQKLPCTWLGRLPFCAMEGTAGSGLHIQPAFLTDSVCCLPPPGVLSTPVSITDCMPRSRCCCRWPGLTDHHFLHYSVTLASALHVYLILDMLAAAPVPGSDALLS